jgi:hypothetical protein
MAHTQNDIETLIGDAIPNFGSSALPVLNSTIKSRGCCWMRLPGRFLRSVFSKIASLAREVRKSQNSVWLFWQLD